MTLFFDGMPVAYSSQSGKTLKMPTGMFSVSFYQTYVDEIRISNVARSADEIKAYVDYARTNNLLQ
jgi:hypothetical protein